ncbi:MAG TPA: D-alanyl-D-alanine carboxypeptidase/D-alanyl-D-alanine-endopeptidase [Longimicrobiaceae bacterium]|nr:D-alanyl-D-alanine carboxypeptidase/D-alanyl-D-alanine-endopeptidase [Longimicrobiaceae bacterium]
MPAVTGVPLRRARAAALLAAALLLGPVLPAHNVARAQAPATARPARDLAARIDSILGRSAVRRAHWGVEVRDAATGRVLYSRDADRLFVPASNLKLVVAAAAAHHLDPGFRFRTTLSGTGPVQDGVLRGDLVLYGRGDPMLSARYFPSRTAVFEALADSLLARGVRAVAGGVVADESWFDADYVRGDWESYDLLWWYAAPVSALGFNDNSIDFRVEPGTAAGAAARITWQPESGFVELENRTRTVAAGGSHTLDFERVPGTRRVRAYGQIPLGTAPATESFAVESPALYAGTVFREVLERRGVRVGQAEVRVVSDPARSPARGAAALAEHASPPLERAIGPVLQRSQNWFAEQLAKTLGREVRGEGSWSAGLAVEREFLVRVVGVDSADFVLRDASGLSAGNLVTPRALVQILEYVRRTPRQAVVRRSLPVSGREGSLQTRLGDLPGRVAAKTGYIGNVDSLSGFLTTDAGREVVFAIVANASGQPSARMKAAIDDVVRAIAAGAR